MRARSFRCSCRWECTGRSEVGSSSWALSRFFFQAEDGIRDDLVTGVQTCALPILFAFMTFFLMPAFAEAGPEGAKVQGARSEERRVGKECWSRWVQDQHKNKVVIEVLL